MATDGFKYFRSKTTGLTGRYPEHFSALEDLVEIDSEDAECIDCYLTDEDKKALVDPVEMDLRTDFKVADVKTPDEDKDKK